MINSVNETSKDVSNKNATNGHINPLKSSNKIDDDSNINDNDDKEDSKHVTKCFDNVKDDKISGDHVEANSEEK